MATRRQVKKTTKVAEVKAQEAKAPVDKTEEKREEIKENVEAIAEEIKEAAEAKTEEVKKVAEAKAKEAKKVVEEVKKEAETKVKEVKKTAAKVRKTVAAKREIKTDIVLQYGEKEVNTKDMIAAVKKEWTKSKNKVADIKSIELYVKPEDYAVYYVINGDTTGKIWL